MIVKDVIAIASSILLSVGGTGVLICACSGFLAERIAKRIDGKYQQKLDQEIEKFRGMIEQKKYVSQSQFDYEFEIYKKLSKTYFTVAVKATSFASNYDKFDALSIKEGDISADELYALSKSICDAQNTLFENAAFIPEDIYNDYYELDIKTNAFFWKMREKIKDFPPIGDALDETNVKCDKTLAKVIEMELQEINKKVRKRLESLAIIQR